jgi:hypothetical protein
VVGASEGEAILLANWVRHNTTELESLFSVSVTSLSWVASDVAPVGHIAVGTLTAVPVTADAWAVVAMSERLQHCKVTRFITQSLRWAGVSYATVAIDQPENNVEIPEQAELPEGAGIEESSSCRSTLPRILLKLTRAACSNGKLRRGCCDD